MLKKLITVFITLPIAIILIVLSVANRGPVAVTLDPFNPGNPALTFELPLFLVVFIALMAGVVVGGIATWLKQGRDRKSARREKGRAEEIRAEADALKKERAELRNEVAVTPSGLPLLGKS